MHANPCNRQQQNQERQLLFDVWRNLKGNQNNGINIRNFKLFLLAIMKFNYAWMKMETQSSQLQLFLASSDGN